jgi:hypothetical protein
LPATGSSVVNAKFLGSKDYRHCERSGAISRPLRSAGSRLLRRSASRNDIQFQSLELVDQDPSPDFSHRLKRLKCGQQV